MKLFLIVNFTFIFLLMIKGYLINIIMGSSNPAGSSGSINEKIMSLHVQMIFAFIVIISMITFNSWWRKKHFQTLDPKIQISMKFGRNSGLWIALITVLAGFVYFYLTLHK